MFSDRIAGLFELVGFFMGHIRVGEDMLNTADPAAAPTSGHLKTWSARGIVAFEYPGICQGHRVVCLGLYGREIDEVVVLRVAIIIS